MIIAAICFLFYELWKLLHPQKIQDVAIKVRQASRARASGMAHEMNQLEPEECGIVLVDFAYAAWTFIALIWFPEWRFVAGIILAMSVTKALLPKSKAMTIADSALCIIILATAIIYFLGASYG